MEWNGMEWNGMEWNGMYVCTHVNACLKNTYISIYTRVCIRI